MKVYRLNEFAKEIGVAVLTLQMWDNKGILVAYRTPTNRRYYTEEQLQQYQKLSKRDKYVSDLCEKCGKGYTLKTIDFERCIYKDLGNGYDIEISSISKRWTKASIYVWFKYPMGEYKVVKTVHDIPHNELPVVLQEIERRYANE